MTQWYCYSFNELLFDSWFKHTTLSKYNEESETRKLEQFLKELMEMCTSEEKDICIALATPKKQKLTALDKLLGPENLTMETCIFDSELVRYLA